MVEETMGPVIAQMSKL